MIDPIQDPLADRLRAIHLDVPPRLVPSVLAGSEQRRPRGLGHVGRLAAAAIAVLMLITGAGSYFAPRFADALAAAPVIGGPIGELLRGTGMVRVQGRLTSFNESATSANFPITLEGGYADAFQTLLIVHIDDPKHLEPSVFDQVTLTDQFGRSYERQAESWTTQNQGSVDEVITFAPLQWPASWTGARLTLTIAGLQFTPPQQATVQGHWVLHGILDTQAARSLSVPAEGRIGSTRFHFLSLRTSPAAVELRLSIDGPLVRQLNDVGHIPMPYKPQPGLTMELVDANGIALQPLGGQLSINGEHADLTSLWIVPTRGRYDLIVNAQGSGRFSRQLNVP